jgi:hypothetical protein
MTIGQSYWPDLRLVRLMRVIGVDPGSIQDEVSSEGA